MAISYVAAGTTFSATASSTSITINKPAGLADGDVMVAFVAFNTGAGVQRTVTCSGWTVRQNAWFDTGTTEVQVTMLTRSGLASDPASWTATVSGSVWNRISAVSAYRGVQTISVSANGTTGSGSSLSTGTVNNTLANAWRVVCGAYSSGTTNYTISSNETTRRSLVSADDGGTPVEGALWDSNAGIVTGNTSRTVSRSANWQCAAATIILLHPSSGTPASGSWASTVAKATASGEGEVHDDATLTATAPVTVAAMEGYGQPPVSTGPIAATTPTTVAAAEGGTDVIGAVNAVVPISVELVGETRAFGERVIRVERDDRTIRVESRAVAD